MHNIFQFKSHYQKLKALYLRWERFLMPATLLIGFLVDYITFINIEISTTLTLLFAYWLLAGETIIFIHLYDAEKISIKLRYFRLFAPLLIQFTFGALLGGSFIFYWFSGSLAASWPFILIFTLLMVSNDVFRNHFQKPIVHISVYYFICLSLFSVELPYLFNSLSPWLFILAGALGTTVIYLLIKLLSRSNPQVRRTRPRLYVSVAIILATMNFFYFANIIPPIPLALRDVDVYHDIQRSGNSYLVLNEPESFWQKMLPGRVVHLALGERIFIYSAIFAPAELNTTIRHRWEHYNENTQSWTETDRLSFDIIGGRKEGYRGFSWKWNPTPGDWRVYIETESGKVLGRLKFKIQRTAGPIVLEELVR